MKIKTTILLLLSLVVTLPVMAQDEDDEVEEIIVSGVRATQGGAQDIDYFRGQVLQAKVPHPSTITAEGLFSQHDILFTQNKACEQLFCLSADVAAASLIAKPEAKILVGLGFGSSLDPKKWKREPVNIVAVVDKSGSMEGEPLDLVRRSLTRIVKLLGEQDQISIVLYGDTTDVYLAPTKTSKKQIGKILTSISNIQSAGSTAMEAGLQLGFETAFTSQKSFKGNTRVILFTDERPNVGRTDSQAFMSMAIAASQQEVGLTTIGVGDQFGAELATKISSVRGGNLFFIASEAEVNSLFERELDFMVSELAHDLVMTITPQKNFAIAGIYGVPGELLGWQGSEAVTIKIPTIFLSSNGGAIFFSLAQRLENSHLPALPLDLKAPAATVSLSYLSAIDGKMQQDQLSVESTNLNQTSSGMLLGHLLVDEYTSLYKATSEHYINNNQEEAYRVLGQLQAKLTDPTLPEKLREGIQDEVKLVGALYERFAFLSGHSSESTIKSPMVKLWGTWQVTKALGNVSLKRKDLLTFSPNSEFNAFRTLNNKEENIESEEYQANEKQVYLMDSELTFDFKFVKSGLILRHARSGVSIHLKKLSQTIHQ